MTRHQTQNELIINAFNSSALAFLAQLLSILRSPRGTLLKLFHHHTPLLPRCIDCALLLVLLVGSVSALKAQDVAVFPSTASASLPDSPGAGSSSSPKTSQLSGSSTASDTGFQFQNSPAGNGVVAGHLDKYIEPNEQVPSLRVGDKVLLGFKDSISPLSAAGWVISAGWEQLTNNSPNYGTGGQAFAQRLGASAARDISEAVFSDSIMSSVLHEDPRYYKMGAAHNVFKRTVYAGTRTLITRTDGGRSTLNLAYLSGNLAGATLTQAYYPPINRGFSQVLQTYGTSIGGGALGFLSSEFLDDILRGLHLKKAQ